MDLIAAAILGVVEGATEFIPVSSTGHLILVGGWLGFTGEDAKTFEIFIQLGAVLAVAWLYRQDLARAIATHRSGVLRHQLLVNIFIAFLPAAIVGVAAHGFIWVHLFDPRVVAVALVVGGVAMLVIERWRPEPRVGRLSDMSVRQSLGIGLAQILSLVPGVSRSGATIMGAYTLGLTRKAAAEFSFFLAIPVMIAATGYDLVTGAHALTPRDVPVFAVGFVVAFATALVVVRRFVEYVGRASFTAFAWYRIGFGLLLLAWFARRAA